MWRELEKKFQLKIPVPYNFMVEQLIYGHPIKFTVNN